MTNQNRRPSDVIKSAISCYVQPRVKDDYYIKYLEAIVDYLDQQWDKEQDFNKDIVEEENTGNSSNKYGVWDGLELENINIHYPYKE